MTFEGMHKRGIDRRRSCAVNCEIFGTGLFFHDRHSIDEITNISCRRRDAHKSGQRTACQYNWKIFFSSCPSFSVLILQYIDTLSLEHDLSMFTLHTVRVMYTQNNIVDCIRFFISTRTKFNLRKHDNELLFLLFSF